MEGVKEQLENIAPVKAAATFILYIFHMLLHIVGVLLHAKKIFEKKGK